MKALQRFAILAVALTAGCGFAAEVGKPMPFVPPAAAFDSGKPAVDITRFKGKVLYVDFWASWCVPCRTSMPALEELHKKFGERGFVVIGINKDDRIADAQRFLQRYPATFTQAIDADEKVVRAFAVAAMPSGYLVDRKGVVRRIHTGFTQETATSLDREIEGLLKEAP